MLKKITNNLGLKIISAFFAVVLWLVVITIDDPIKKRTFYNLDVNVVNAEVITNDGKVYKVLDDTDKVTITVEAKRTILDSLSDSDFEAVADMNNIMMTQEQLVPIQVSAKKYNSKIEITQKIYNMKVSVEDVSTKQFAINIEPIGEPSEGYAIGEVSAFPNVLKVSGPDSIVSKIKKVVAEVNVSGMSTGINDSVKPTLYDEDGIIIESSQLSYDNEKVAISAEILETKDLALNFIIEGEVAEGYRYMQVEYQPQSVKVKGTYDVLQSIDSIPISSEVLSLTGATENITTTINISQYLQEGVQLVNKDDANVAVTLVVEKLASKKYKLPLKNIKTQNLANTFDLEYTSNESVEIVVQGLESDLNSLTVNSIKGTIDLEGKKAGTHIVTLAIVLPDGFSVVGNVTVTVKIIKEEADAQETVADESDTTENNQENTTNEDRESNNNEDSNNSDLNRTDTDGTELNNNE